MTRSNNSDKIPNLAKIGLVVIGRNEGDRLRRCLMSVVGQVDAVAYVDSGSSDGSLTLAKEMGVETVNLDMSQPFTAARARNLGARRLLEIRPDIDMVQFVDGDCELVEGWLQQAVSFLQDHGDIAVVCGRCRERFPDKSIYNRLCDMEWDTPIGEAEACGGNAMMRIDAFEAAGRFRDDLIAGEEPELCLRLRHEGWKIWRLDTEMVLHDAAITKISQWWRRSVRGGYSYANVTWLYQKSDDKFWRRSVLRILTWGSLLPLILIGGAFLVNPWFLLGFLIYPLQVVRIAVRLGYDNRANWLYAGSTVLDKFPGMQGVVQFYFRQLTNGRTRIIEYK